METRVYVPRFASHDSFRGVLLETKPSDAQNRFLRGACHYDVFSFILLKPPIFPTSLELCKIHMIFMYRMRVGISYSPLFNILLVVFDQFGVRPENEADDKGTAT